MAGPLPCRNVLLAVKGTALDKPAEVAALLTVSVIPAERPAPAEPTPTKADVSERVSAVAVAAGRGAKAAIGERGLAARASG